MASVCAVVLMSASPIRHTLSLRRPQRVATLVKRGNVMRAPIAILIVLLVGCSERSNEQVVNADNEPSVSTSTATSAEDVEGIPYRAPADPNATYTLLSVKQGKNGRIIAMTRRAGSSGTSYSNREIDCGAQLARYIGEGDTREEAEKPASNPGDMAHLVEGSSTHAAVQAACANS